MLQQARSWTGERPRPRDEGVLTVSYRRFGEDDVPSQDVMNRPAGEHSALRDFLQVLRRHLIVIVITTVLVPSAALAFALSTPKEYTATAQLLFRDPGFDQKLFGSSVIASAGDPAREAATNVTLVSLDNIFARVASVMNRPGLTASGVRDNIRVVPRGQADVVAVEATDHNPAFAARLANAVAAQYIRFRREADRSKITHALNLVRGQKKNLEPREGTGQEAQSVRSRIEQLELLASLQTGNAELVQPATAPDNASSPQPLRDTTIGLIAGLFLGLLLAAILDRLDRRLRQGDAEALLRRPVLAVVPESRVLRQANVQSLHLSGREGVAFRTLRTNLRYFSIDREVRSLLITSAAPGDGKSTVAKYLAATAAASGVAAVLVEADLRRPTVVRGHPTLHSRGLTDVLSGQASLTDVIQRLPLQGIGGPADGPRLEVVAAGPVPPNPADLLESDRMRDVLAELETRYDLVIVDSSPLLAVPDAVPVMTQVSGVAIVVRERKSTKASVRQLRKQLDNLNVTPVGIIINGATAAEDNAYYAYTYAQDGAAPDTPDGDGTPKRRARRQGSVRSG